MGEITARLVEQNPENEAEIMKVLSSHSSHSSKYQEKGTEILKQYGLYEDLDSKFFPHLNNLIINHNQFMMWGLIAFGFYFLLQTTCNKKLFSIRLASLLELQKR